MFSVRSVVTNLFGPGTEAFAEDRVLARVAECHVPLVQPGLGRLELGSAVEGEVQVSPNGGRERCVDRALRGDGGDDRHAEDDAHDGQGGDEDLPHPDPESLAGGPAQGYQEHEHHGGAEHQQDGTLEGEEGAEHERHRGRQVDHTAPLLGELEEQADDPDGGEQCGRVGPHGAELAEREKRHVGSERDPGRRQEDQDGGDHRRPPQHSLEAAAVEESPDRDSRHQCISPHHVDDGLGFVGDVRAVVVAKKAFDHLERPPARHRRPRHGRETDPSREPTHGEARQEGDRDDDLRGAELERATPGMEQTPGDEAEVVVEAGFDDQHAEDQEHDPVLPGGALPTDEDGEEHARDDEAAQEEDDPAHGATVSRSGASAASQLCDSTTAS
jgi:hypothetical protein